MRKYGLKKVFCLLAFEEDEMIRKLKEEEIEYSGFAEDIEKADSFSVVVSRDRELIKRAISLGAVTILVVEDFDFSMDEKADLILIGTEGLDLNTIYSTFCHVRGLPYQIAENDEIYIRELCKEDVDAFIDITREEHNTAFLPDGIGDREEQKEKLLSYISQVYEFFHFGIYGVFLKENNTLIGAVSLDVKDSIGRPEYEIGFFLSHYYIGKGYGIMAVELLIEYAFLTLNMERLVSVTASSNFPAIKLLKKAGFVGEIKDMKFISVLEGKDYKKDKEMRNE